MMSNVTESDAMPSAEAGGDPGSRAGPRIPAVARGNIESIAQIEQEFVRARSTADRVGELINRIAGSSGFIVAHLCLVSGWILVNTGTVPAVRPFDPFPFSFLGVLVSLEAVFLMSFVLMTQRRQTRQAEHWAHLNLQVGLLAEQEATKMLQMLTSLSDRLGLNTSHDIDLKEMIEKTAVNHLAQEMADNLERTRAGDSRQAE